MPFRSPKMYFCIFGFQRLVWWPKCTPASRSSFIVNAAMDPPRFASAALRRWSPTDSRAACVMVMLRRVLAVDSHVLLAEVAGPDAILAPAQPQVDRDVVLLAPHDLANALETHAFLEHPAHGDRLLVDPDRHLLLVHAGRGLPAGHHDPPPVGVLPIDRRLHERRVRHAARREQRIPPAGRAADRDRDELRRALPPGGAAPRPPR